jgi:glutathione S-transferase
VADAYLYTTLTWAAHVGVDLSAWPALEAYRDRIAARPAVQAAAAVEFPPR